MFFAVGIPFFFLTVLGFKLLSPTLKSLSRTAIYTLIAIWIIAVAIASSIGIRQASAFAEDGRVVKKENLNFVQTDTLMIKFVHNDFYSKNIDDNYEYRITEDSLKNKVIFSTDVSLKIESTDEKTAYIKIEKEARGKTFSEANERANQIQYKYKLIGNNLILDNYFVTDYKNQFRDQEVEITLYLPKGTVFKCDKSVENYDRSDDENFNLHFSGNYNYKVFDAKIKCLNCPDDENEYNDVFEIDEEDNFDVKINEDGISIKKDSTSSNGKELKELRINKDGIIVKTK
jgi:hypothetical protein